MFVACVHSLHGDYGTWLRPSSVYGRQYGLIPASSIWGNSQIELVQPCLGNSGKRDIRHHATDCDLHSSVCRRRTGEQLPRNYLGSSWPKTNTKEYQRFACLDGPSIESEASLRPDEVVSSSALCPLPVGCRDFTSNMPTVAEEAERKTERRQCDACCSHAGCGCDDNVDRSSRRIVVRLKVNLCRADVSKIGFL